MRSEGAPKFRSLAVHLAALEPCSCRCSGCRFSIVVAGQTGHTGKVAQTDSASLASEVVPAQVGFQALKAELQVRGLPKVAQLGCDHFGGIEKAPHRSYPRAKVVTSLWHLQRNISRCRLRVKNSFDGIMCWLGAGRAGAAAPDCPPEAGSLLRTSLDRSVGGRWTEA